MRKRVAAVGALAVLSGCAATPAPLGVLTQSASPRREVLQYFPGDAPVVALVHTDPTAPEVRRLIGSGVLGPLRGWAAVQKLRLSQYETLLGNDAAVGQPHVGGPPLLVLVTPDASRLEDLAESRVVAHLAVPAQDYRGAHLYDAGAWAFAVRGPVLLVGQDTAELTEALDQRTQDGGFDADQLEPAHPGDVARGLVDLSALLTYAPAELRGLPLAQAVTDGDLTMRAEPGGQLIGTLTADTAAADLTAADLPPHDAGPVKLLDTDALPVFGAADLGEALAPAERALRLALPVTALQLDAIRMRLERAGVALTAPALHGPAWALDTPHGLEVLWHPAQPAPVRAALARAAASYRQPGVTVTRSHGFYAISSNGQFIARVGMIGDTFIAGAAPATDLRFLAQLPETRVTGGGVAMRIPRRTFLPRLLTVAAGTSGAKLTLRFVAAP